MLKQFKQPKSSRISNMKGLFKLIRESGPLTKNSIMDKTGLKQTTCTRVIDDLLKENLIKESGVAESSGGRKPILYNLNTSLYYSIGIDISRTFIKVLLLDIQLNVLGSARLPMNRQVTPEHAFTFINETVRELLAEHRIREDQLAGIGIGSVEPIDREKGILLEPMHFPNEKWHHVEIIGALKENWDTVMLLDSGMNAAVLAEYQSGLKERTGNITQMIAGMGLRLGTMIDHRLVKSEAVRFSKFGSGHIIINTNGRKCICGKYGCLHTYATIPALIEEVSHQIKLGKSNLLQHAEPGQLEFDDICKAVAAKDSLCKETIEEFAFFTGIGIANMVTLVPADYIVLGGPMFNRLPEFYETAVNTATERLAELYPGYNVRFIKGKLGENATAIGAGGMIFDYYLD